MRYCLMILLLLMPLSVSAQNTVPAKADVSQKPVLVSNITIEGFVLGDKSQFIKIFKPYRSKYLTTADMDEILEKVQGIYEREGYKELVSISYELKKRHLIYTVLMTS